MKRLKFNFSTFLLLILFTLLGINVLEAQIVVPHSWKNDETLIVLKRGKSSSEYLEYSVKNGTTKSIQLQEVPKSNPSLQIREGTLYFITPEGLAKPLVSNADKLQNPTFSPDFKKVAFVRDNDLYSVDVETSKESRLTYDGSNLILNGRASWVYFEEIFGRASQYKAFWWSPDSRRIAFYRFDDSKVPMFPIYDAAGKHGSLQETRYPKAGDPNPEVKFGFVDSEGGDIIWADFDPKVDQYFGTPYWNSNGVEIMVQWMDRDQSNFILYSVDSYDGNKRAIYKEYQKSWIDWIEDIQFGAKGFYFVRDFEMWEHIYYQSYDGTKLERLTDGMNWGVKFESFNEEEGYIVFTARRESSLRKDLYKLTFNSPVKSQRLDAKVQRISVGEYDYSMPMVSPNGSYIVASQSNLSSPTKLVLLSSLKKGSFKAGDIRVLSDNKPLDFEDIAPFLPKLIFTTTPDGFKLPGTIIYPQNFDSTRKYPVIVNIYGGPNSTNVMDIWRAPSPTQIYWAKEGVIQVYLDNRASGHFGKEGINYVHRNLGHYELKDFIEWARYLGSLPYVNSKKIGITGFSFGGTMTVLALTQGADYFQYGIAGGGVYDWLLYDSHYTERYMDHPDNNPEGYAKSAATKMAALYRSKEGSLLYITHGTGDDNVHMQNTYQLIDALQNEGKHFELMLYPGGMHGYRGKQGMHSQDENIRFWRKTLLDK